GFIRPGIGRRSRPNAMPPILSLDNSSLRGRAPDGRMLSFAPNGEFSERNKESQALSIQGHPARRFTKDMATGTGVGKLHPRATASGLAGSHGLGELSPVRVSHWQGGVPRP